MSKLLSSELFKLKKCIGLRVCLIVFLSYSALNMLIIGLFDQFSFYTGYTYFNACLGSLSGSSIYGMLLGFLAASIITTDYKSRDIQCEIAQGYSRAKILVAKTIIYMSTILVMSLLLMIINTVGYSLINGFGCKFDSEVLLDMIKRVLLAGYMTTMLYTACIFLAVSFMSKAASVALNILVFFVLNLGTSLVDMLFEVFDSDIFSKIARYFPFISISEVTMPDAKGKYILISMLVALLWGVLLYVGTWAIFRKRNMR